MKFRLIDIIKYAIPLVVAFLLLRFYVFKELSLADMIATFQQANYSWVIFSGIVLLFAHWSRAYRWRLLLEPLGYKPSMFRMFLAVMIGYFANLLLPRMGEVSRCGVLNKMNKVPINAGIGTVVAERLFDVVMLLLLLCLNFLLEFNRLSEFFIQFFTDKFGSFSQISSTFYLILIVGVLFITGIGFWAYKNQEKLWKIAILAKVRDFFLGMWEGLVSVRKMQNKWSFIAHSFLIWIGYYFAAYLLTFALPDSKPLGWMGGLTILMMGSLGMAAPVQGGTGPYHLLVSSALMLYGWSQEEGIILATFIWASQTLLTIVAGGICFVISLFINRSDTPSVEIKDTPSQKYNSAT
ncbi:lysylphosphatidylglycerol synthase transmembrane domain-containing protein [Xanthocytophaga flava]|uniref:lysylphosphatidylglycerol synthase transmembrane domain-containing protein n=1 Tax=Xanthocytophaga flava TaxID=3048013 RepID=UPI0028D538ED|nr:lysylphosphatidylglycerol synthase transmembrane domain-containing protein [Xanthocytophaga flavus]MDJ1469614.1 lysylphosphatidylglycerol synthase transmembrane domain-containing protein [Xanthocytophaga flavus]